MKKITKQIAIGLLGFSLIGSVAARHHGGFYDKARVTEVIPIYETVEVSYPEERCWTERVPASGGRHCGDRSYTPVIVGAIVGCVVGHQIGGGRGKDVATVAGTLLGASIGHDLGDRPVYRPARAVERCGVVERYREEERLAGYRVEYRYKGRTFVTRRDEYPGDWIKVRVDVDPVGRL